MDSSAFNHLGKIMGVMMLALASMFPLGVWKFVEIIIWLFKHINISWN